VYLRDGKKSAEAGREPSFQQSFDGYAIGLWKTFGAVFVDYKLVTCQPSGSFWKFPVLGGVEANFDAADKARL
jgi:hypothetical protein